MAQPEHNAAPPAPSERRALVLHPPHWWRGLRISLSERWPVLTLGFFTIEIVRPGKRLVCMLAALRQKTPAGEQ